jgi:hypothetical protein
MRAGKTGLWNWVACFAVICGLAGSSLVSLSPAAEPAPVAPPVVIQPDQARRYVGQRVEVTFPVKKAKYSEKRKTVYLDSEVDFHLETNLGIAIVEQGLVSLKEKQKIDAPADHFRAKTIRVVGEIVIEEQKPYIKVTDAAQISIAPEK